MFLVVIFSPFLLLAFVVKPKFRAGFWQKIGFYHFIKKEKDIKHIVVHAVSVGEVIAVEKFLKILKKNFPNYKIILTTVTKTGHFVAKQKLSSVVDEFIYFPFDFFFSVRSFVRNIKPDIVVIAETEIWPYFSNELKKNKIPLLIINGRISPNSHKGYKKFKWFFAKVLGNYANILMQTNADMNRIVDIGANPNITKVMGNLKFDIEKSLSETDVKNLKNEFKSHGKPVLIAGSTHKGEDEIILDVYKKLCEKNSNLKLILAPRHPERLSEVENLLRVRGFLYGKRSEKSDFAENQVVLVDTMGELAKLYSISDVAFLGGSFSKTGGHNPLEAAIFDIPVVSGPSVFNFKDIYKFLTNDQAAFVVQTDIELFEILNKLFTNKSFYQIASQSCQKVFSSNSGAIENALDVIKDLLE